MAGMAPIRTAVICVLLTMVPTVTTLAAPRNLAAEAKITASGMHGPAYDPIYIADGKIPESGSNDDAGQAWCLPQGQSAGATLTFEWPNPVRIAEIVYWGRAAFMDTENFSSCEIYTDNSQNRPIASAGLNKGPQPQPIPLEKPIEAKKLVLRFPANYGGANPGASEIAVYDTRPPDSELPKPHSMAYSFATGPILADLRSGKLGFTSLLLVRHQLLNPTHVYTYHQEGLKAGGSLVVCDFAAKEPELRTLVDSPSGLILDANLHYDGRTILFSWKRTMQESFQLYTIDIDGKNLKKISDDPSNNFNAAWLPDGGIVFLSDRKSAFAYCWRTTTPILFRCGADGSNAVRISANYLNDMTPAVLEDGRIVYSRWEYVDRPAIPIQSLWAINPDGTSLSGVFGNRVLSPATFMDAREIPDGGGRLLCVMTAHNGPCRGAIGIIDPKLGSNAQQAISNLTPEISIGRVNHGNGNTIRGPYLNPFPLDDKHFLVSKEGSIELRNYAGTLAAPILSARHGPGFYNPQPLRTRSRENLLTSRLPSHNGTNGQQWATIFMQDVYTGLDPTLVPRGSIKRLAIVQEMEKPIGVDPERRAFGFQFPVVSAGATYAPKKVWGHANVEDDGSAYFKVPAREPIYFLPLDAEGRAVQRMRTFTHLMPGEVQGCIGCHAERNSVALKTGSTRSIAMKRPPEELEVPSWGLSGFSYSRNVQPVWNKHCLGCHGSDTPAGGLELTGDKTDFFNVSYDNLVRRGTIAENYLEGGGAFRASKYTSWIPTYNGQEANILEIAPGRWGAKASLLAAVIHDGHKDKDGKPRIDLPDKSKRAIYAWLDLNCPFYSSSDSNRRDLRGCRQILPPGFEGVFADVAGRRCASCHRQRDNRRVFTYPNSFALRIDNPARNTFLRAPLGKAAGGTEACGRAEFTSTDDPDYQKLLHAFDSLKDVLDKTPRLDMIELSAQPSMHVQLQP